MTDFEVQVKGFVVKSNGDKDPNITIVVSPTQEDEFSIFVTGLTEKRSMTIVFADDE